MKRIYGSIGLVIAAVILAVAAAPASARVLYVNGQRAEVERPANPNGILVLYVHGAGGSARSIDEAPQTELTRVLLDRGFTVASDDANGTQNWGDPASVADYVQLIRKLGFKRVEILAQSMGGLDGVELIDRIHPIAWAGIYPVDNLASIGPSLSPIYWGIFETAWAGQPPKSVSPAKAEDVSGLPVMIWASPEDTIVPKAENADVLAQWMRNEGAEVTEFTTEGDHGDPSNFHPDRLAQFYEAAGKRAAS